MCKRSVFGIEVGRIIHIFSDIVSLTSYWRGSLDNWQPEDHLGRARETCTRLHVQDVGRSRRRQGHLEKKLTRSQLLQIREHEGEEIVKTSGWVKRAVEWEEGEKATK